MLDDAQTDEVVPDAALSFYELERLINLDLHRAPPAYFAHTDAPIWTLVNLLCSRGGLDIDARDSTAELLRWANAQNPATVEVVCKLLSSSETFDIETRPALSHLFRAALEEYTSRFCSNGLIMVAILATFV